MTDPYAREADDSTDATIPLVPDSGYARTEQVPFAEETLVDTSPWSAAAADSLTAPGYGTASAGAAFGSGDGNAGLPPVAATPTAPTQAPAPASAAYGPPGYGDSYTQPSVVQPQTNYVQPQAYPTPQAYGTSPAYPTYPAPQAYPAQQAAARQAAASAPAGGYATPARETEFAEPAGPADRIGAQDIYQGYPTAGYGQQPAWPAVIPDPVGYDYGYSRAPAASEHPNATTSLVLGIVGLAFFQVLSPVAWFMAAKGRREMARYPGRWRSSGILTAGLVLGIIGTILLGIVGMFVLIAIFALLAGGL